MRRSAPLGAFQRRLLAWHQVCQRKLPWRQTRDPCHILVSEIMLQQTQVGRVIPKRRELLTRYPTPQAPAKAKTAPQRRATPLGCNIAPEGHMREL